MYELAAVQPNTSLWANGMYYITLQIGKSIQTAKLTIDR